MEKYKEYKDSGVQWLGEIPSHWIIKRLASMFTGEIEVNKDFYVKHAFKFNFGELVSKNEIGNTDEYKDVYSKYSLVKKGDIVINGLNLNYDFVSQRVACTPYDGIITSAYIVCRPRQTVNYQYYTFLFKGMDSIKLFHGMGTGIRLTLSFKELRKQLLPLPPLAEQRSIVSYLDTKCSLLDTLLSNKEKQISLLQEMKQRVIADAVTRGVNPNIKFKATNIPWLSEIPEHWEIKPIRSLLREVTEKSETGEEELLSLSQYTGVSYKKDAKNTGMFEAESTIGYKKVYPGQFVMNIMLAWNGSYAVSDLEGIISPAYCVFDFISDCDKMYYHYLLRLGIYSGAFKTASRGIIDSRLRLYPNRFYPFPIVCPPIDEQRSIVSYITERTSKIDLLIEKLNKEIECIKEYKQRLISDVVTGQVKVS